MLPSRTTEKRTMRAHYPSPLLAIFVLLFFLSGTSSAAEYLFQDRDGDLIADPPRKQSELVDPEVLYFSMSPEAEKKNLANRYKELIAALSQATGKEVRFLEVESSLDEIEQMKIGKLHIAGFSTGTTGFAVNLSGFVPLCVKAKGDEIMGYHLQVIVRSDSAFHSLKDLRGKTIAHTSSTSNSGNIAPRALLPNFDLIPDKTYKVVYSGKHKKSILGVADGTYPAAAVASSTLARMISSGAIAGNDIRILYTSPKFPTLAMGYAYNLTPDLISQIRNTLLNISFSPELIRELKGADHYLPVSYRKDWEIIRHIAEYSGYSYTTEGLQKMLNSK